MTTSPSSAFFSHPRRRSLHADGQCELVLSYYPAGHHMAEHAHDCDQRSIILAGALAEDTPSRTAAATHGHLGFKAAGLRHANRYGPDGALILAVNAPPCAPSSQSWGWTPASTTRHASAVLCALVQSDPDIDVHEAVSDLRACVSAVATPDEAGVEPPHWLQRVREAVRDGSKTGDVQALACEAGVHRVHLSRAYVRHFGIPISVERRHIRLARSVRVLIEQGERPAHAALAGGFSDQAHFTRVLRQETGLTPQRLVQVLQGG